jgi:hypothetical protein
VNVLHPACPEVKSVPAVALRPDEQVWARIEAVLAEPSAAPDAALDKAPVLEGKGIPWLIFVSLLVANGWFLEGRGFASLGELKRAPFRLAGFVAIWIAALVWLPLVPTLITLALWVGYILPKVRWLGQEFQNVATS